MPLSMRWPTTRGRKDAVVLACFGDPGLAALKEIAKVPVVGMADASILQACAMGNRFSIVTGGERWKSMLEEFVAGHRPFLAARLGAYRGADRRRHRARSQSRDGAAGQGLQRLRARGRRRRGDPGRRGPGRPCRQAEDDGRCAASRRGRLRDLHGRGTGPPEAGQGRQRSARFARAGRQRRTFACADEAAWPPDRHPERSRPKGGASRASSCRQDIKKGPSLRLPSTSLSIRARCSDEAAASSDDNPAFI